MGKGADGSAHLVGPCRALRIRALLCLGQALRAQDQTSRPRSSRCDGASTGPGDLRWTSSRELRPSTPCADDGGARGSFRMLDITKVPGAPGLVEGIINLRGNVIPVLDLRKRFRLEVADRNKDNRILVVDIGGQDIGVVVDAVTEVLRIASDSVEPPSSVITTADSVYLLGIVKLEGRLVILLDLEKVLSDSEKNALSESTAMASALAAD